MSKKGYKHTLETKSKMSKFWREYIKTHPYHNPMKGKHHTKEARIKISDAMKKKIGEKNHNWKGGISKDFNKWRKELRHQRGISKKYRGESWAIGTGESYTKEYKRLHRQKYKYLKKNAGDLTIKTIQLVYEDNIKKYGTLTCYLCLEPILFGKDHLEHKIPLSRGGTNIYDNLAIACQRCNNRKTNKTEEEFRNFLIKVDNQKAPLTGG